MSDLTIKKVPPALHRRLKRKAAEHRRSLNNEIISLLEQAVPEERNFDVKAFLEETRKLRKLTARHPLSAEEIKSAISEGRP